MLFSVIAYCSDIALSVELESGDADSLILMGSDSSVEFEYCVEFGLFPEVSESVT